ncbi:hypothetical protein D9615_002322 [Tricholomella constricta]|uniref:BTB domain-containing protein n=1 Tax=Tricholomella constricta TaxID=117010 RepID=A0A8H5HM04_9AGAR|nr:hypothetical protein D9615_002322 [Tricholomella constricta]
MPALRSNPLLQPAQPLSDRPRRHPCYYMPQGNVVIRVQNTLFKLDLSVLHETSRVLRIITPPLYAGKLRFQGFDDEHPFVLHETTEHEFVRLLWVLYPSNSHPFTAATVDDWMTILNLAHKYEMDDVCALAVARLHASQVDPIRKIAIWDKYHLDPYFLASSYVALCQRVEPLTLGMTMTIGLKNFTKLAAARDLYHQRVGADCCKRHTPGEKQVIAEEIVMQIFSRHAKH